LAFETASCGSREVLLAGEPGWLRLVESCAGNPEKWEHFLADAERLQATERDVRRFLWFVLDCCLLSRHSRLVPAEILHRLRDLIRFPRSDKDAGTSAGQRADAGAAAAGGSWQRDRISIEHTHWVAAAVSGDFYNFIERDDGSWRLPRRMARGTVLRLPTRPVRFTRLLSGERWGRTGRPNTSCAGRTRSSAGENSSTRKQALFSLNFTIIDPTRGEIQHANAGMPFLFLLRQGQPEPERLTGATGPFVGPTTIAWTLAGGGNGPAKGRRPDRPRQRRVLEIHNFRHEPFGAAHR